MGSATSLGFPYPASTDPPNVPSDVQALAAAINTWLTGPAWQSLPLASGVTAATGAGTPSGSYLPEYRIWTNGLVEYRGAIKLTAGGGFTAGATLFSVPTGANPACVATGPLVGNVSTGVTENGRLEVTPADGLCRLYSATGDYTFVYLDALRYYVT